MNATAITDAPDCSLPDWLSSCLIEHGTKNELSKVVSALESAAEDTISSQDNNQAAETTTPLVEGNQLVCRAFEFAYQLHKGQLRASARQR